jgi:hypothetical protein
MNKKQEKCCTHVNGYPNVHDIFNRTRCTVIMNVLRITACHVHVYNTGSKTCML